MATRQWTQPEIAARLGVPPVTVRVWLHRGQVPTPSGRVGQSPWWAPDVIEPWMDERAANAAQEEGES